MWFCVCVCVCVRACMHACVGVSSAKSIWGWVWTHLFAYFKRLCTWMREMSQKSSYFSRGVLPNSIQSLEEYDKHVYVCRPSDTVPAGHSLTSQHLDEVGRSALSPNRHFFSNLLTPKKSYNFCDHYYCNSRVFKETDFLLCITSWISE